MRNVFISDLRTIKTIFQEDYNYMESLDAPFKDSLVVYSFKEKLLSFDELKSVVNSYRSIWEDIINNGSELCLDSYDKIMNSLERLGTVVNVSKEVGVISWKLPKPPRHYLEISVFLKDFDGDVILWNNDITGDQHILGLGKETNFFTINNYL